VGFFVCLGEWERGSKPRDAGRLREFGEHVSPPQARGEPRGTTPGDSRRYSTQVKPISYLKANTAEVLKHLTVVVSPNGAIRQCRSTPPKRWTAL
jgi:hypothetical protein